MNDYEKHIAAHGEHELLTLAASCKSMINDHRRFTQRVIAQAQTHGQMLDAMKAHAHVRDGFLFCIQQLHAAGAEYGIENFDIHALPVKPGRTLEEGPGR